MAPLHLKFHRVVETALRASWFWPFSARFAGTWGIFSSPGDSELSPEGLSFQWNELSKTFWKVTFELLGRNIAPLHLKTYKVAKTTLVASWVSPTSAPFPGSGGIFFSLGDSKLILDGLGLQWNEHSKTFWTLTCQLLGRNIAPLYLKTYRVAETTLASSWFWPTSARFPGTWGIFSSLGDSKLTPDGLGLQWNRYRKTFSTLTLELLGQNIATLEFKTQRVAKTTFFASWFWPTSARFPGTWGIFSSPGDSKLTPDCLGFQGNGHGKTFWTLTFELLGRNIAPLYLKTYRVAETTLGASWFWPSSARFPGTSGIFSSLGDSKLTPDGLGLQWNGHRKTFWTLTFELLGRNIAPLHFKIQGVAETALRASWFWPTLLDFPELRGYFPVPGTLN